MKYEYKTKGTCSSVIRFELEGEKVKNVEFTGGCNGNLQFIQRLVEGLEVSQLMEKCRGIKCGSKGTSCADQLFLAVSEALEQTALKQAN